MLVTNLMDEEAFPAQVFKELYYLRWGVEECYKRLKQWVEIENFSGKSALSVKQDYYAKIPSLTLRDRKRRIQILMLKGRGHAINLSLR